MASLAHTRLRGGRGVELASGMGSARARLRRRGDESREGRMLEEREAGVRRGASGEVGSVTARSVEWRL